MVYGQSSVQRSYHLLHLFQNLPAFHQVFHLIVIVVQRTVHVQMLHVSADDLACTLRSLARMELPEVQCLRRTDGELLRDASIQVSDSAPRSNAAAASRNWHSAPGALRSLAGAAVQRNTCSGVNMILDEVNFCSDILSLRSAVYVLLS